VTVTDVIWIFFLLSALQPLFRQRLVNLARTRKIQQIEKQRGSRVILLVHRQETMRFLGFPVARYIDVNDSEELLHAIRITEDDIPLDIVLHTPGGLVLAAVQIAHAVRARTGKVTVFVPHYAMSGGTLIALAADEIVMCPHSVLGPIDPQIGQMAAASILKVVEQKPIAEIDDQTLMMADLGRKAIAQVKRVAHDLIAHRLPEEQAEALAEKLSTGTWTHDYPIFADEAKAMGLPVNTDMPNEVLDLMTLYPQPVRSQTSGVQYLPVPRGRDAGAKPAP
jgi:ClpP class serine protease